MTTNSYLLMLIALAAGMMMPTQATTNNKMATVVGSPIAAAFLSFVVGTIALFGVMVATGTSLSSLWSVREAPPVAWLGGFLGAFFVAAAVLLTPRLGVAMTFSLFIAGQMIMSLVIDHFGLLGLPVKEVSMVRVFGILLITAGVVIIRKL